jgi:hypothetical protein
MAESASATIAATQLASGEYQYTLNLNDTGTTTIGTFWFAWIAHYTYRFERRVWHFMDRILRVLVSSAGKFTDRILVHQQRTTVIRLWRLPFLSRHA